jgi:hypothetical protein
MSITLDTVIQQSPSIFASEIDGDIVFLNAEQGHYFGANTVGLSIWELAKEPRSIQQICEQLGDEYEGFDADSYHEQVLRFVKDLHDGELIVIVEDA